MEDIEGFNNRERRHTTLGILRSPAEHGPRPSRFAFGMFASAGNAIDENEQWMLALPQDRNLRPCR